MTEKKETKGNTTATPKTEKTKTAAPKETKMQDLKPIKLTQAEFDALDDAGLRAKLCNEPQSRISRERGKAFLVAKVADGKINSITPEMIESWTYSAVRVDGVDIGGQGFTAEKAKETLSKAAFGKLNAAGFAALIDKYTHKRRAADVIIPDLITAGMPVTAEDVVHLTCGRIAVEGVTVKSVTRKTASAITKGVKFA